MIADEKSRPIANVCFFFSAFLLSKHLSIQTHIRTHATNISVPPLLIYLYFTVFGDCKTRQGKKRHAITF